MLKQDSVTLSCVRRIAVSLSIEAVIEKPNKILLFCFVNADLIFVFFCFFLYQGHPKARGMSDSFNNVL